MYRRDTSTNAGMFSRSFRLTKVLDDFKQHVSSNTKSRGEAKSSRRLRHRSHGVHECVNHACSGEHAEQIDGENLLGSSQDVQERHEHERGNVLQVVQREYLGEEGAVIRITKPDIRQYMGTMKGHPTPRCFSYTTTLLHACPDNDVTMFLRVHGADVGRGKQRAARREQPGHSIQESELRDIATSFAFTPERNKNYSSLSRLAEGGQSKLCSGE
ncbi:hypothetical protein B566_EDAN001968 [Ephemera danica]|nr:hypothetical protein B566_EDAN001968 [Ephemera danica]